MINYTQKLERFDLLIPKDAKVTMERLSEITNIKPRTLGRLFLVEKIREFENKDIAAGSILADFAGYNFALKDSSTKEALTLKM